MSASLASSAARAAGRSLEQAAHVVGVVDLLHRHPRDEVAVPDDTIEIAFLPQPREAFADRRAAHPVLGREADLGQRRAGAIAALDDAGLEVAVGALDVGRVID